MGIFSRYDYFAQIIVQLTHFGGTCKIVTMHILDLNIQTVVRIYFFSSYSTTQAPISAFQDRHKFCAFATTSL